MTLSVKTEEAIQPATMLLASTINVIGAIGALVTVPESRKNIFFYTSMITSIMYLTANFIRVCQVLKENSGDKAEETIDLENPTDDFRSRIATQRKNQENSISFK